MIQKSDIREYVFRRFWEQGENRIPERRFFMGPYRKLFPGARDFHGRVLVQECWYIEIIHLKVYNSDGNGQSE